MDVGPAGWHQAGQDWWHGLNLAQISVLAQPMGEGPRGAEGPLWSAFPGKCLLVGEIKLLFSESLSLETPACTDTHARPGATEHPERHTRACTRTGAHTPVRAKSAVLTHTFAHSALTLADFPHRGVHTPIPRAEGEPACLARPHPHFCKFPSAATGLEELWQGR